MKKWLFIIGCIAPLILKAQVGVKDSSLLAPLVTFSYGAQMPGGDMAKRFGNNNRVMLGFSIKTKSNWLFGVEGSYIYGKNVKEKNLFDSISISLFDTIPTNLQIGSSGFLTSPVLFERGYNIGGHVGKIFHVFAPNPNSGIVLTVKGGFWQHKIRIQQDEALLPQLSGDYKKGYDRLSNGPGLGLFLGYIYLGNSRMINITGGIDVECAFTQSRRSFDFDKMKHDDTHRKDIFWGARIGWILPLYKRSSVNFYYN